MKRFVSLFLVFALTATLAGCTKTPASSPTPTVASTAASTPTVSGVQQVFLPNGALPYDSYKPVVVPERYYENAANKLIPSKDYGHIWPYVGGFLYTQLARSTFYGLCDAKGRIICEPVFHKVDVLEKDGAKLYEFTKYITKGKTYASKVSKITLARPDGTWADEYDEILTKSSFQEYPPENIFSIPSNSQNYYTRKNFCWRSGITNDYISVRKGEQWGVVDYYGNEILPCVYSEPLCFSEGLAALVSDNGKTVSFINSTGKAILGPYQTPPKQINFFGGYWGESKEEMPLNYGLVFSEGRMRFYKDGKFGVIDKSGKTVIEAKYDYISSFFSGTAMFLIGDKYGVLDMNGVMLKEATENFISGTDKDSNSISEVLFISDGVKQSVNLHSGIHKSGSDINAQYGVRNVNGIITITLRDGKQIQFPNAISAHQLNNGNFALNIKGSIPEWIIVNSAGETVAGPIEGRIDYTSESRITQYGAIFINIGKPEIDIPWSFNWMTIYDETGKRLLPGYYLSIQPFDGRYLVRDDTDAGLLDESGHWALKVPLYDYQKD